jgi:hypothetical protein
MIGRKLSWRVSTLLSFGAGLVSFALACGDEGDGTATPTPDGGAPDAATEDSGNADAALPSPAELDAFCRATLGLYAPRYAECCDPAAAPKRYAFDESLLKGVHLACTMSLGKSIDGGRATFASAPAGTCATNVSSAIEARTCPEVLRTPSNQPSASIFNEATGCAEVLVGRQAADAPCANDYECIDGLTCIGWTTTSDGACKPPPGEGALCAYAIPDGGGFLELVRWGFGDHPRCAAGLYCDSMAMQQGTCKPRKPADGTCDSSDECAEGLRCQVGVCGTAGPAPVEAPCERSSDCQDRLYCKSADGGRVCAAREVAGSPCSNEFGSECEGACVKPDGGSAASCVAYCGSR